MNTPRFIRLHFPALLSNYLSLKIVVHEINHLLYGGI